MIQEITSELACDVVDQTLSALHCAELTGFYPYDRDHAARLYKNITNLTSLTHIPAPWVLISACTSAIRDYFAKATVRALDVLDPSQELQKLVNAFKYLNSEDIQAPLNDHIDHLFHWSHLKDKDRAELRKIVHQTVRELTEYETPVRYMLFGNTEVTIPNNVELSSSIRIYSSMTECLLTNGCHNSCIDTSKLFPVIIRQNTYAETITGVLYATYDTVCLICNHSDKYLGWGMPSVTSTLGHELDNVTNNVFNPRDFKDYKASARIMTYAEFIRGSVEGSVVNCADPFYSTALLPFNWKNTYHDFMMNDDRYWIIDNHLDMLQSKYIWDGVRQFLDPTYAKTINVNLTNSPSIDKMIKTFISPYFCPDIRNVLALKLPIGGQNNTSCCYSNPSAPYINTAKGLAHLAYLKERRQLFDNLNETMYKEYEKFGGRSMAVKWYLDLCDTNRDLIYDRCIEVYKAHLKSDKANFAHNNPYPAISVVTTRNGMHNHDFMWTPYLSDIDKKNMIYYGLSATEMMPDVDPDSDTAINLYFIFDPKTIEDVEQFFDVEAPKCLTGWTTGLKDLSPFDEAHDDPLGWLLNPATKDIFNAYAPQRKRPETTTAPHDPTLMQKVSLFPVEDFGWCWPMSKQTASKIARKN